MNQLNIQITPPAWSRSMTWSAFILLWSLPGIAALSYYYLNQIVTAQPMNWNFALVSTLPNWYIWGAMSPVILWVARRFRIERSNWKRTVLGVHVPIMGGLMLIHALVNLVLFRSAGLHDILSMDLYRVHFTSRFHANVLTYWTVLGIYYAYDYSRKYRVREQQAIQLQVQLAQANLRALKMQLHPHFLFNTLHSIASLVRKNENKTAISMLVKLGDFLRLALENKGVQEIPLQQELDFLSSYLAIEKIRFRERLAVDIKADPSTLDAYVPNMILQPLVENAIYHGIAPHAQEGTIEIQAQRINGKLILQVLDSGPGIQGDQTKGSGVGLSNIRSRLENLYGKEAHFSLRNAEGGGLMASIRIPFNTHPVIDIHSNEDPD